MPQVIPAAAYYAALYLGGNAVVAAAVAAVASYAVSDHERRKANRAARDAHNNSLQDRLVMTATTNGPRSRVYGRARNVDGILFKGTWGPRSEYYTMVVAIAGHECDEIEEIYFNDKRIALQEAEDTEGGYWVMTEPILRMPRASASVTVPVVDGVATVTLDKRPIPGTVNVIGKRAFGNEGPVSIPFSLSDRTVTTTGEVTSLDVKISYQYYTVLPKARVWKYLGTEDQNIGRDLLKRRFPDLINVDGNDDRFAGITAVVVEYEFDPDAFPTGIEDVTALVRGAKIYDPRTEMTTWTQNPAIIARDWARLKHAGNCNVDELLDSAFIAAANACDVPTVFNTPNGPETRPLYQCGIACKLDGDPVPWMDEIVESMAGKWGWAGGQLTMVAGVYRASVAHITEDWIIDAENIEIVPQPPRSEVVNVYRPSIANADAAPTPPIDRLTAVASDGVLTPAEKPFVKLAYQSIKSEQEGLSLLASDAGKTTERSYFEAAIADLTAYMSTLTAPVLWSNTAGNTSVVSATFAGKFANVYAARQVLADALKLDKPVRLDGDTTTQAYVVVPMPEVRSDAYIEADGQELAREVDLGGVTHNVHAQHVCGVLMRDAREGLVVKLPCNSRAWTLELFDVVTLTLPFFGFEAKEFEVLGWKFSLSGGVVLTLKETAASIYDPNGTFDNPNASPNTTLPLPWYVPEVENLEITSDLELLGDGTPQTRAEVTWEPILLDSVAQGGRIEVQYHDASEDVPEGDWQSVREQGSATSTVIRGLKQGHYYLFRARAINTLFVRGPWTLQQLHRVAEPPNDAAAAAEAAQEAAESALQQLDDIASDNVLTPGEKPAVILDYQRLIDEQADILAKATAQAITTEKTNYTTALAALTTYLGTLIVPFTWSNLAGNTMIVGATFRAKFADVYAKRQVLLNLIAVKIANGAVGPGQIQDGAVDTPSITPDAVTATFTSEASDGSIPNLPVPFNLLVLADASMTNPSVHDFTAEATFSIDAKMVGSGTGTCHVLVQMDRSIHGTTTIQCPPLGAGEISIYKVITEVLAPGETFSCRLILVNTATSGSFSLAWRNAQMKQRLLKR